MARKLLLLNGVEEKEFKTYGKTSTKRNGIVYDVEQVGDDVKITPNTSNINVVAPLDLPKGTIILTHDENRELREKGQTTHTRGGVTYSIVNKENKLVVSVVCEYESILFKSEC